MGNQFREWRATYGCDVGSSQSSGRYRKIRLQLVVLVAYIGYISVSDYRT